MCRSSGDEPAAAHAADVNDAEAMASVPEEQVATTIVPVAERLLQVGVKQNP